MLKRLADMFGLVTDADRKMLAEMTISDVVEEHIRWKLKLQSYVEGKSKEEIDPDVFRRPELSTTGKWTTLHAAENLAEFNAFFTLRAKMEQCHHLAGEMVEKVKQGDRAAAAAIMKDRFLKTSHELVHSLIQLENQQSGEG